MQTYLGHICENCKTNDTYQATFHIFNENNVMVAKLHRWILQIGNTYQAKVVAKSKEWMEFEQVELQNPFPNLYSTFYNTPNVLIINSDWYKNLEAAKTVTDTNFVEAKTWLEAKLQGNIEIVQ